MNVVKAKLDIIFKKLFTSDDTVLKAFVADILDIPIDEITQIRVENPNILPSMVGGKQAQLDLRMSVDDKIVNVEIQLCDKGDFRDRSLYYWSKMYSDELKKGEEYFDLKKTISVNILNFDLFDCKEMYSDFSMREKTRNELLTDKCSILFFELTKLNNKVDKNDRKRLWLQLINAETEEELDMLDKTGVPEIQKAVVILHEMSADEQTREIARLREKAIYDERSAINSAKREGIEQERERAIAFMREKGLTEDQIREFYK